MVLTAGQLRYMCTIPDDTTFSEFTFGTRPGPTLAEAKKLRIFPRVAVREFVYATAEEPHLVETVAQYLCDVGDSTVPPLTKMEFRNIRMNVNLGHKLETSRARTVWEMWTRQATSHIGNLVASPHQRWIDMDGWNLERIL